VIRDRTIGVGLCLLLIALAGCGLLTGIDDLSKVGDMEDAATPPDEEIERPGQATPKRCDPNKPFGEPVRVQELWSADPDEDADARLTDDERTIYFQSTRETNDPKIHRVWVATRPNTNAEFGEPTLIELEPGVSYRDPAITPDGLTIFVQAGVEDSRIQFATRPDPGAYFFPPQDVPGLDLANEDERDPYLARDGRLLYTRMGPRGAEQPDIHVATGSVTDGYQSAGLARVNSTSWLERNPVLSADGRRIFFSSNRDSEPKWQRIWTAYRDDPTEVFGDPVPVTELAVPDGAHDYDAPTWLSVDGCVLYFASNRDSNRSGGPIHIFRAERRR
jgi:hypothetical protein